MHVKNDTRILPSFFYPSSYKIEEHIYIGSKVYKNSRFDDSQWLGIEVDNTVTVVNYKSKTVQNVLTEIAGLLIFSSILNFFLEYFNEWMFNKNINKKCNEDFRDVFTY